MKPLLLLRRPRDNFAFVDFQAIEVPFLLPTEIAAGRIQFQCLQLLQLGEHEQLDDIGRFAVSFNSSEVVACSSMNSIMLTSLVGLFVLLGQLECLHFVRDELLWDLKLEPVLVKEQRQLLEFLLCSQEDE